MRFGLFTSDYLHELSRVGIIVIRSANRRAVVSKKWGRFTGSRCSVPIRAAKRSRPHDAIDRQRSPLWTDNIMRTRKAFRGRS